MPLPYASTVSSWAADTYHGPRGPAHPHPMPQYEHQLHAPASYNGGAPGIHHPSQLQPSQHPRTSHAYQLADMSSSVPQHPYPPPPPGVHPHYAASSTVGYHERLGNGQGRRSTHPSQLHSVSGAQPHYLANTQSIASTDMQTPRSTEYQFDPSPLVSPTEMRSDPMRISDLVASGQSSNGQMHVSPQPDGVRYSLNIRQQPIAARSCGFGERDRRVIDPPPIVQLLFEGPNLTEDDMDKHLRYQHYVMSCSITHESGSDASYMPEEYRQQRRLMGSLVATPFVGNDEHGRLGCFFCFPDLSCRTPGSFRLKFSMVKIYPALAKEGKRFPDLAEALSEVFTVYTAKDFPGMQASTKLTKTLKGQGCIISIKKGNDRSKNARSHDDSSEGEQDDGEIAVQGKRQRRSTRQ
ncbi:velc gibm7 ame: sexual development regulator velc [Fusarium longipes]|uniref:Velc gibm7 ame: sexual development regulator velc n=1 Tax=Fusarium longipes TaxID=694270 RepID=A0A395SZ89_9HYPO|nr:velc gibm7 ame: sexual development regulator velc [Fusarium longipes]